jgi:hypothetical protein
MPRVSRTALDATAPAEELVRFQLEGKSARAIAAPPSKRSVPTPHGGPWYGGTVLRVKRQVAWHIELFWCRRTRGSVEIIIFILAPVVILLFALVVRVLGTNLGYKVLLVFMVLYFVLKG